MRLALRCPPSPPLDLHRSSAGLASCARVRARREWRGVHPEPEADESAARVQVADDIEGPTMQRDRLRSVPTISRPCSGRGFRCACSALPCHPG